MKCLGRISNRLSWAVLLGVACGCLALTAMPARAVSFGGEVTDLTAVTGREVVGTPTSWTNDGTQYIASRGKGDRLLVFSRRNGEGWRVSDLTAKLGRPISGPPVNWMVNDVEHLAATGRTNEVLVFYRMPGADWAVVDVTKKTRRRIASELVAWRTKDGPYTVEHLAGRTRSGHLVAFHWSPRADWRAIDVSSKTKRRIVGNVTPYQEKVAGKLVEHLVGRAAGGEVLDFHWRPDGRDWQVDDVRAPGVRVSSDLDAWSRLSANYLAGRGDDGSLVVLRRSSSRRHWRVTNVSEQTGDLIAGRPTCVRRNGTLILIGRDASGSQLQFWTTDLKNWQALNLTDLSQRRVSSEVAAIPPTSFDGSAQIAFEAPTNRLVVLADYDGPRQATDDLQEPADPFKRRQGVRRTLAILWDPHRGTHPAPSRAAIRDALFGPTDSLRDYLVENSRGDFTIQNVGVLGWYDADYPGDHYWQIERGIDRPGNDYDNFALDANATAETCQARCRKDDGRCRAWTYVKPGVQGKEARCWLKDKAPPARANAATVSGYVGVDVDGDGFLDNHGRKYMEALRNADKEFDFSKYDRNRDRVLTPDELAIIVVVAQDGPYGAVRAPHQRTVPSAKNLVVDGVTVSKILEWYTGAAEWSVAAHEAGHLLLDHVDMYIGEPNPNFRNGMLSIMDYGYNKSHFDPLAKLKAGWLQPRVILRDGTYALPAVETTGEAWILMDPRRGTSEYFIVENRNASAGTYDRGHYQSGGLAVWHVIEDREKAAEMNPPRGVTKELWDARKGWTRSLRVLRPLIMAPAATSNIAQFFDQHTLFDGADPAVSHDILSRDPDLRHPELVWADGTPSGFNIRNISAAGAVMTATIDVPFERPKPETSIEPKISSTWEPSFDRPGRDYRNFSQSAGEPRICMDACLSDQRCAAWTFVKPGVQGATARCWLKSSVPGPKINGSTTSGVKYSVEPDLDRPGKDFKSFWVNADEDADACRIACLTDARCRAWTYVRPGVQGTRARCWLKDALPSPKVNSNTVSGVVGRLD